MPSATARSLTGLCNDLTDDELLELTDSATRPSLKEFLATRIAQKWHHVSYEQSAGLVPLINLAVGLRNVNNVSHDITQERFPLKGTGVQHVKCHVEAYLDGETSEEAAKRLTDAGHVLGNTGDLAGYLHNHPEEVAKWPGWVAAISENSRWTLPDGHVLVPYARVDGSYRRFNLSDFRNQLHSRYGVLVVLGE